MDEYSSSNENSTTSYMKTRNRRNITRPSGPTGTIGPTGYSERYLSITQQRISKLDLLSEYLLFITIDKYLSYNPDDNISVKSIDKNEHNEYQSFEGQVKTYNSETGELIIKNIENVSEHFYNYL